MLLSGCCAVSVLPAVCEWVRSIHDFGSFAPKRSRMIAAHMRRRARYFATSSKKWLWVLKIHDTPEATSSALRPRASAAST